jgi:predicted nucleic acid-binding protein
VWRLCLLDKELTRYEASGFLRAASGFLTHLRRIQFEDLEANRILDIAILKRLTFYDASYTVAAETKRLMLVTDDSELLEVGREYVSTPGSAQI